MTSMVNNINIFIHVSVSRVCIRACAMSSLLHFSKSGKKVGKFHIQSGKSDDLRKCQGKVGEYEMFLVILLYG